MDILKREILIEQLINAHQLKVGNDVLLELSGRLHDECRRLHLEELGWKPLPDIKPTETKLAQWP